MISVPEITLECIAVAEGHGEPLRDLALKAATSVVSPATCHLSPDSIGGVIVATFSNERRFPALAVELVAALGLPPSIPAFDLQLACSAYPYAIYLAGRIAADTGKRVLVIDGDVQSRLVDPSDHDTGSIFSDAVTATLVSSHRDPGVPTPDRDPSVPTPDREPSVLARPGFPTPYREPSVLARPSSQSYFDFYNAFNPSALSCSESGPIRMKGFDVFSFVATDVLKFLKNFLASLHDLSLITYNSSLIFVPHQAQPYMVRQLAKSLGLSDRLLTLDESKRNPGSCSIPMTLAAHPECRGRQVLLAGFGAGYSASAAVVKIGGGK